MAEEDARRMAEASRKRFDDTDLALVYGSVNLRKAATGTSRILGVMSGGTLVHVLDQEPGSECPWCHVRFGEKEGWISGNYAKFPEEREFGFAMWGMLFSLARATEAQSLWTGPEPRAESAIELPKDAPMHVMMEAEAGWPYVMVPRGEPGWKMDLLGRL